MKTAPPAPCGKPQMVSFVPSAKRLVCTVTLAVRLAVPFPGLHWISPTSHRAPPGVQRKRHSDSHQSALLTCCPRLLLCAKDCVFGSLGNAELQNVLCN